MHAGKNDAVADIKNRLDIGQVIGKYVPLKRAGINLRGLCPFHGEKTPSFFVTPSKQIWHCFGCNQGGDVFSFIQKIEHLEFPEALQMLADLAGVELESYNPKAAEAKSERELIFKINNFAAEFYHRTLLDNANNHVRDYLKNRGLASDTIAKWRIGFAPTDAQSLAKALATHKITDKDLSKAGIYAQGSRGSYDRFYGRITFPIHNLRGQVVGFSARTLENNTSFAKYVNSAESPVYHKSESLFGLQHAKDIIAKSREALVVEGQMDCISVSQAGFENVVGTSGTAFTESQVQLLKRLASTFTFAFDNDSAGQTALWRAVNLSMANGVEVKIVNIENGKDPDELVRSNPEQWQKSWDNRLPAIEHYLKLGLKLEAELQRRKWVGDKLVVLINHLKDPLEKEYWQRQVSENFMISANALSQSLSSSRFDAVPAAKSPPYVDTKQQNNRQKTQPLASEQEILHGLATFPEILDFAKQIGLSPIDFPSEEGQNEANKLLLATPTDFVVELSSSKLADTNPVIRVLLKSCCLLRLQGLKMGLKKAAEELKKAQNSQNHTKIAELETGIQYYFSNRIKIEKLLAEFK